MDYNYLRIPVHPLHGYFVTLNIIISCLVSQLHRFTWVHDLIIFIEYWYVTVYWITDIDMIFTITWIFSEYDTWLFPVFLILIWYSYYLDISTTDLRCAKLSAILDKVSHHIRDGGHLLNPVGSPLESHVLWILCLMSPVILLHVIIVISV